MKNFDQIERYLNDEMSESQRQLFEQTMEQDTKLAEEVRLQQFEESAIDLMIEDDFLDKISKIASEEKDKNNIVPINKKKSSFLHTRWIQMAVAASVLLVAVFYINSLGSSDFNPTELAMNTYEKKIPNFSAVRSTDQLDAEEYNNYSAYISNKERHKMEETIRFFKTQEGSDALYKTAHAYLLNKDFDSAIETFLNYQSTASKTERDYSNASFYLGLSYLGKGDIEKTRSILDEVKGDANHIFQKDAKSILKALKEME